MSGTGKSSVIRALADFGYKAIDTDDGWCEQLPDGRQRWREDAITILLATEDADVLFVAGYEENQARFHPQFDRIILLSAPVETMMQRLADRTSNPYGKTPGDLGRVLSDTKNIELCWRIVTRLRPVRRRRMLFRGALHRTVRPRVLARIALCGQPVR
jgi:dephospho-CoA kinase